MTFSPSPQSYKLHQVRHCLTCHYVLRASTEPGTQGGFSKSALNECTDTTQESMKRTRPTCFST